MLIGFIFMFLFGFFLCFVFVVGLVLLELKNKMLFDMSCVMCPKDAMRVQRSIASIMSKIEASLKRTDPFRQKREEEFESSVRAAGLIYFP